MSISVVLVRGILSEVRSRGLDPDELLRATGIDPQRVTDIRETVAPEQGDLLVRNAVELTGDPALGLAVGANAPESMLQVFGHLILSYSTMREAFAAVRRYSALVFEGPTWDLLEQGERAMLVFQPALQLGDSTRFLVESTLVFTARVGYHFISTGERVTEVHVQHAAPSYESRYLEVFGCPVLFKQAKNALVFPRRLLDMPQLHADSTVRAVLRDTAERLLQERSQQSAAERVRTLLRWESNLATVDIDRIARHLGMSARALRRRLGAEGAPLSTLIDEARCAVACRELRRPGSTIKETAELLGFSEPSAFHRAFKRWTGRTPAEYGRTTDDAPVTLIRPRPPEGEDHDGQDDDHEALEDHREVRTPRASQ